MVKIRNPALPEIHGCEETHKEPFRKSFRCSSLGGQIFVPSSNCYQPHDIAVRIPRFQRMLPFNSGRRVKLGAEADTCMMDPTKMGCGMQSVFRRFLEAALVASFFFAEKVQLGKTQFSGTVVFREYIVLKNLNT